MNEIPESVTPLENMHETSVWTRPPQENGNTQERTIHSLRKELLDAKNNLAALENALEDRQMEFDALVEAAQTKTSETTENERVKRKNRLATAILETEQATARMKTALATLNRRIISEYALSKEPAGGTYTPPPPPSGRIAPGDRFFERETGSNRGGGRRNSKQFRKS